MSAQLKEVIFHACPFHMQHFLPDAGKSFFHLRSRRNIPVLGSGLLHTGHGQCLAIDLAAGSQRHFRQRHEL